MPPSRSGQAKPDILLARLVRFLEFVENEAPEVIVTYERLLVKDVLTQLSVEDLLEVIMRFPRYRKSHRRSLQ